MTDTTFLIPPAYRAKGHVHAWTLPDAWFVACTSKQLRKQPLAFSLQSTPLVLFRDGKGVASALLDRCPHRNVPLSAGRVERGELECAYHGWRFGSDGKCLSVPGLCGKWEAQAQHVPSFPVVEQDGLVWVYSTSGNIPTSRPYALPFLDAPEYSTVRREFKVNASMAAVMENTLDVPHTAFLHRGLFRTSRKENEIEVVVRRTATMAEAEFLGEPRPQGLVGKMLAPSGGVVTHFDRFLLPCIAQVEYRLGQESHLLATSLHTPLSAHETVVYAVVTFRLPLPHFLVKPFVAPVATRIFKQDAWMLNRQTANTHAFGGEQYVSSPLDVLGPHMWRLLQQASRGEFPTETYEHHVKMRV